MKRVLPNAITVLRLALLPVFGHFVLGGRDWAAAALLVAMAGSDALDGFLARRWDAQSRFGAVLDPLADKLTQVTGLVLLTFFAPPPFTRLPSWLLALVLARDLLLTYGALRIRLRRGRVRIQPRWEGKLSTLFVFGLLLAACLGLPGPLVFGLALLTALLVVASGVRYTLDGRRQLAAVNSPPGPAPSGP